MKKTKAATNYRPATSKNCGQCTYMNDDGSCDKVKGIVDRRHVCDLFKKK